MKRISLLALIAAVILTASCHLLRRNDQPPALPATPQMATPSQNPASAPRPPIEFQAEAQGNAVRFQIADNSVQNLYVGPENFALISPGSRHPLLATDDQVVRRVISVRLAPGEAAAGEFIFLPFQSVVGHRLVFNSRQVEPNFWRADIVAASPASPE
jgi:hypothetical protein